MDKQAGTQLGIGATRIEHRFLASKNELNSHNVVQFECSEGVNYAGVLLMLPFLEQTGLFTYREHYEELNGYYFLDQVFLLTAFMYLCRIKNPEQLKKVSPGEFGKLMGLDRVPETTVLRKKQQQLYDQNQSQTWVSNLSQRWMEVEETDFFYIDGHVQVYYGDSANLGKKYVSRQKLCLPGVQDFWVNNSSGMPYFYVRGEVNEKMIEMLEFQIIPQLMSEVKCKYTEEELESNPDLPRFTIVFDREGYSPKLFKRLWEMYRIAILSYRKKVTNTWEECEFTEVVVENRDQSAIKMQLGEREVTILPGFAIREIRKLQENGHQTTIITTNKMLDKKEIAKYMFARWNQENFFRYMRQNYDLDSIYKYTVNQIDGEFVVINSRHTKLTNDIKSIREKTTTLRSKLCKSLEENSNEDLKTTPKHATLQANLRDSIKANDEKIEALKTERKNTSRTIKLKEMPAEIKYEKLDNESKLLQNIIKMICYRAETSFTNLISPHFNHDYNEKRELVKAIITLKGDIIPDYEKNILTIKLYSLPNPRSNFALQSILDLINQTQTKYPETKLILNFIL